MNANASKTQKLSNLLGSCYRSQLACTYSADACNSRLRARMAVIM